MFAETHVSFHVSTRDYWKNLPEALNVLFKSIMMIGDKVG